MKELTKAEEQIMHILWNIKSGFVKDIIAKMPVPKPAYNTVSTIVRIMEDKGFVAHRAYGKTHEYYPLIDKAAYTKKLMQSYLKKYFGNSIHQMVSFFSDDKDMSVADLEDIKRLIEDEIKNKK